MSTAARSTPGVVSPRFGRKAIHHDPQSAANALALAEEGRRAAEAKRNTRNTYFYAFGRVLIASLFVVGAIVKTVYFADTRAAMDGLGLVGTPMLLISALAIELCAGTLVALGLWVRRASAFLIAYLAAVTLFIHGNLTIDSNRVAAVTNLALAGALLLLVAHGAGGLSLERVIARRAAARRNR